MSESKDSEFHKVIHPWQVHHDEKYDRDFFFNSLTNESAWELPEEIQQRVLRYYELKEQEEEEKPNNVLKYVDAENRISKEDDTQKIMSRPARKQVEQSLAATYAYKQGDQEYNIWYDKFLSNDKFRDREAAPTRCNPEVDAGYTKADFMEKHSSYFCIHFSKGCCVEGANCKFIHRIPTYDECLHVDQVRDIFGRTRHANHRDDMAGVGSFLKECRTLLITDFKVPNGTDPIKQMYEILFRHFSAWGEVENLVVSPGKNQAFVKYSHRCMSEFAKEAMQNQALDSGEVLTIKWAQEEESDDNEKVAKDFKNKHRFDRKANAKKPVPKKEDPKYESGYGEDENAGGDVESALQMNLTATERDLYKKRKQEIDANMAKMASVLNKIGKNDDDDESGEEADEGDYEGQNDGSLNYMPPDRNNMPLFTK